MLHQPFSKKKPLSSSIHQKSPSPSAVSVQRTPQGPSDPSARPVAPSPMSKKPTSGQIDLSTLTSAQKQMCLKLLAQTDIKFEQELDGFSAQLKINPKKITSEFCPQSTNKKKQAPESSAGKVCSLGSVNPIKQRNIAKNQRSPLTDKKLQQNHQKQKPHQQQVIKQKGNKNSNKQEQKQNKQQENDSAITGAVKKASNPINKPTNKKTHCIYNSSRKPISKAVRMNDLKRLQQLHPEIELYVYPKKLSFQALCQVIETIYDSYDNHIKQKKQRKLAAYNKNSKQQKNKNYSDKHHVGEHSHNDTQLFVEWVYRQHVLVVEDTNKNNSNDRNYDHHHSSKPATTPFKHNMKTQQNVVNLIESLNHYSYKHPGVQIFYNFLSGVYSLDTLEYFLIIRTLLQQLYSQKILEKVSDYSTKKGYKYRINLNTFEKEVEQDKVYDFLEVCCYSERASNESSGKKQSHKQSDNLLNPDRFFRMSFNHSQSQQQQSSSLTAYNQSTQYSKQDLSVRRIFEQMTELMYFDERRKKNFITFYEMTQILLRQFIRVDGLEKLPKKEKFYGEGYGAHINCQNTLILDNVSGMNSISAEQSSSLFIDIRSQNQQKQKGTYNNKCLTKYDFQDSLKQENNLNLNQQDRWKKGRKIFRFVALSKIVFKSKAFPQNHP